MRLAVLRPILAAILILMIGIAVADAILGPDVATYDSAIAAVVGERDTYTVQSVPKEGNGLHVGERVRVVDPGVASRLGAQRQSAPMRVQAVGGGKIVTLHAQPVRHTIPSRVWDVLRVGVLVLALAVLLLRGGTVPGLALATFLALTGFFANAISDPQIGAWWRTAFVAVQGTLASLQTLALIVLLTALGQPSALRRRVLRIGVALCIASALYQAVGVTVLARTGLLLPFVDSALTGGLLDIALLLYAVFTLVVGLATTQGADRRRLAIVGCALVIGEFNSFYNVVTTGNYGDYTSAQVIVGEISLAIMAVGLAYAILVERLFDIGFVVNRAVVYGAISTIVVPVFIAVEWAVEKWAGTIGHVQGATIEMLVAVAIGLSLRPLHQQVDRFVDDFLFAQRHRAANALTRFAREAHLIVEPRRLFEATAWTLRTFARIADCDILLREDDRTFRSVLETPRRFHEDDVLVVRLRASGEPVMRSAFPALTDSDAAFPMLVRGSLHGIMLVALPPRAEPYSPEEIHALALVAREIAFALVALDAAEAKRLREENADLRARLLISNP